MRRHERTSTHACRVLPQKGNMASHTSLCTSRAVLGGRVLWAAGDCLLSDFGRALGNPLRSFVGGVAQVVGHLLSRLSSDFGLVGPHRVVKPCSLESVGKLVVMNCDVRAAIRGVRVARSSRGFGESACTRRSKRPHGAPGFQLVSRGSPPNESQRYCWHGISRCKWRLYTTSGSARHNASSGIIEFGVVGRTHTFRSCMHRHVRLLTSAHSQDDTRRHNEEREGRTG